MKLYRVTDGWDYEIGDYYVEENFTAGECKKFKYKINCYMPAGQHELKIEIDINNGIYELDDGAEDNNECTTGPYTWNHTPTLTVHGSFDFYDENESARVTIKNAKVELYDDDGGSGTLLASGTTNDYGEYSLGPIPNKEIYEDQSYQDIYVRIYSEGNPVKVVDALSDPYHYSTEIVQNCAGENGQYTFTETVHAPSEDDPAYNIYDVARSGYLWAKNKFSTSPTQATAIWYPTNTQDTGYDPATNMITILGQSSGPGPDQWNNDIILYEYGHFIADWQGIMDPAVVPEFTWHAEIGASEAWTAGWAYYFSCAVRDEETVERVGTDRMHTINLENGDEVVDYIDPGTSDENYNANNCCAGAAAGILWDIYDDAQDDQDPVGIGDESVDPSHENIINVVDDYHPSHGVYTIHEFWDGWRAVVASCPVSDLWATFYEHGIDKEDPADIPVVDVLFPDGGEELWGGGDPYTITWEHMDCISGVDRVDIKYSNNAGTDWITEAEGVSGTEEYSWDLPTPYGPSYLVKIIAYDRVGNTGDGVSESVFEIKSPPFEWGTNGEAVACSETGDRSQPQLVSHGDGGAIITWQDDGDDDGYYDIYAQRVNADGEMQWTENGVVVCSASGHQTEPRIASDGAGGAIITWRDARSGGSIYAQRISSNGIVQWTANGVAICTASGDQTALQIISDGSGGAIITWEDCRDCGGFNKDIYAQRINAGGTVQWTTNGVAVCTYSGDQIQPVLVTDGSGGTIIAWEDHRRGWYHDIYAQRVGAGGSVMWQSDGNPICEQNKPQENPRITSDYAGGAIITWVDNRRGMGWDIYAQRVRGNGTVGWTEDGVLIRNTDVCAQDLQIASSGTWGAIIAWSRSGIYAQKVSSNGYLQWDTNGMPICTCVGAKGDLQLAVNGAVETFLAWYDDRTGDDIYAQHIDANGNPQWREDGFPVCKAPDEQRKPQIVLDVTGGAVIAWQDDRSGNGDNCIYAQRMKGETSIPSCEITWEIIDAETLEPTGLNYLNGCPQGDWNALRIHLDFDNGWTGGDINPSDITLYVDPTLVFHGPNTADSAATSERGFQTTATRPYVSINTPCSGGCDYCPLHDILILFDGYEIGQVGELSAKSPDYNGDGSVELCDFSVFATTYLKSRGEAGYNDCYDFTYDQNVELLDFSFFAQHYLHYYSPPSSPGILAKQIPESNVKIRFVLDTSDINQEDKLLVSMYLENADDISAVVMGLEKDHTGLQYVGWSPAPQFSTFSLENPIERTDGDVLFISSLALDNMESEGIEVGTVEYAVTDAGEVFIDEMDFTLVFGDVLFSDGTLMRLRGVQYKAETPVYRNYLGNNYPNPFNPTTTIEYSIMNDSHVNLSIYNVNGQLVSTLVDELKVGGAHKTVWDGRNNRGKPVASGVYFYKLRTSGFTKSKKLVILR